METPAIKPLIAKFILGNPISEEERTVLGNYFLDAEREIQDWKNIAIYLADVCAATAESCMEKKSTPKHERIRQDSICTTAALSLKSGVLVGPTVKNRDASCVIDRLNRAKQIPKEN